MSNIFQDILNFVNQLYAMFLGLFDFELFGKNIKEELSGVVDGLVLVLLLFLIFKTLIGRQESSLSKLGLLILFCITYLIIQIWVL